MPAKWKFFRIFSYLHALGAAAMAGVMIYIIIASILSSRASEIPVISLIAIGFLVLLVNASINIYLLEKCYPDKLPVKIIYTIHPVLSALCIIFLILVLVFSGDLFYSWFFENTEKLRTPFTLLIVISVGTLIITGFPIIIMQGRLKTQIQHNHEARLDRFLKQEND